VADELRLEPFDKSRHRRDEFDCGVAPLNDYLQTKLGQHSRKDLTRGYVLAGPGGRIAGYFTLAAGRLTIGVIPDGHGYPAKLPLPTMLIGRLAVDTAFKGQRLGERLLVEAMRICIETADQIGAALIEVDAKDAGAQAFYAKYGFRSLPDDTLHMYLPMATARQSFNRS
jgi:ribosomal protein S18 acetylase RimI-like enzyme